MRCDRRAGTLAALILVAATTGTLAHEVDWRVERMPAVVITLDYPGAGPFAFEAVEIRPEGGGTPVAVGRTDAAGRFAFVPPAAGRWEVRAVSGGGHGAVFTIDTTTGPVPSGESAAGAGRWSRLVGGGGLLLGLFGAWSLWRGWRR